MPAIELRGFTPVWGFGQTRPPGIERLKYFDRRWMIIDKNKRIITRTQIPELSVMQATLSPDNDYLFLQTDNIGESFGLLIKAIDNREQFFATLGTAKYRVIDDGEGAARWIESMLWLGARLVRRV